MSIAGAKSSLRAANPLLAGMKPFGERTNIRSQVVEALRAALIAGHLKPGLVYSAPVLAEQFGVSATPVREAMLELVREGMVEVVPNTGFRITEVSATKLDELVELRLLIEVPTMSSIAERCQGALTESVKALRPLAETLQKSAEEGDLIAYLRLDTEFHARFLALAGNETLVDQVRHLRSMSRLYGLEKLADEGRLSSSSVEHEQMIELALKRDRQGMEELVYHHIRQTRSADQSGTESGAGEPVSS